MINNAVDDKYGSVEQSLWQGSPDLDVESDELFGGLFVGLFPVAFACGTP